jgi:hypothetical protein
MSTSIFSQEIRRANERQQRRIESLSRLKAPFADPSLRDVGQWADCDLYTYGKLLISILYLGWRNKPLQKLISVQVASPRMYIVFVNSK